MSGILTAPPSAPAGPHRTDNHVAGSTSPPPKPMRAETARAPQPVDAAQRGRDIRFEDRQGRPVGPPPSFQVSLLQAMQEAALDPRPNPAFAEEAAAFTPPDQVDRKV